jgi:ubiquinone/menaquinone biosynthesis C-methylase UbiE
MTESSNHQHIVRQEYDNRTDAYLYSSVHAEGADLQLIAEYLGQQPNAAVLDMGCGGGHVSFRLAPTVASVMACDLAPKMLDTVAAEAIRRGLTNIATRREAAETLSFPDASFDAVATRFSAHHWRHMDAGIRQLYRVLKPDGRAAFADTIAPADPLCDTWLQSIELLRDASHARNASMAEWVGRLDAAGFALERVVTARLPLAFDAWIARTQPPASHVAAIRSLQQAASAEIKTHFALMGDGSFTIDTAVLLVTKR